MYQEFAIIGIEPITKDKQIIITANKAINENIKDSIIIQVYERQTKADLLFDYEVQYEKLIITLKDWPIPNTDYILGVSGILSVTDEELTSNVKTRFKFNSDVLTTAKILSPAMFEEVKSLDIKLLEVSEKPEDLINQYYIEVATDNAFYNVTNKTTICKDNATLYVKEEGQYFIRARVQRDDSNYSEWSTIISFIYGNKGAVTPPVQDTDVFDINVDIDNPDEMEPEVSIFDPFVITEYPEQGVTPDTSLLIAFSNLIDDMSLDNIIITRKDVR
jgi:hypothetical protein